MIDPNCSLADNKQINNTQAYRNQNAEVKIAKGSAFAKKFLNLLWLISILSISFYLSNSVENEGFLVTAQVAAPRPEHRTLAYNLFKQYNRDANSNKAQIHGRLVRHGSNHRHEKGRRHSKRLKEYVIEQEKPVFIEKCHIIPSKDQVSKLKINQ